jgi:ureidoacrylate peracid hydrolase
MQQVLVLIDIQKEYITPGRYFYLSGITPSLRKAHEVLLHARAEGWKIIHVKHEKEGGPIFSPGAELTEFIDEFKPEANEVVITKHLYSCYSSTEFSRVMAEHTKDQVFVVGYNTIMCCLSTLISAYHLGQRLSLVTDASLAKATNEFTESENHRFAISVIQAAGYANCVTANEVLAA